MVLEGVEVLRSELQAKLHQLEHAENILTLTTHSTMARVPCVLAQTRRDRRRFIVRINDCSVI